ncbi:FAD:protein FMN transferase [Shewanella halifaxensis]|nr:FAD:protein FMN transferase [Shewanella halifaxensis]
MGTTYSLTLDTADISLSELELQIAVEQELNKVNNGLSIFRAESEISKLNLNHGRQAIEISQQLWDVLAISKQVSQQTEGALDITLEPVIEFWGFGVKARDLKGKNRGQLEYARSKTGMDGYVLDNGMIVKVIPDLAINPSAVAKGYGVDRVANVLDDLGIANYLVEIGGELRAKGVAADGHFWNIAILRPEKFSMQIQEVVSLNNMAIATSGSYVNYLESGESQLSHIINPNTGMPVNNSVVSATVLHKQCAVADAFATALMVLDVERSLQIADSLGLAVMLIEQTDKGSVTHFSRGIFRYLPNKEP